MKVSCYRLKGADLEWAVRSVATEQESLEAMPPSLLGEASRPFTAYTLMKLNRINVVTISLPSGEYWQAYDGVTEGTYLGPDPATAIFRCFVASRVGEMIEIENNVSINT